MNIQLKEALQAVLNISKDTGFTPYAKAYARAALEIIPNGSKEAMIIQVRYVLSNLQYWRGQDARDTKKVLNDYINGRLES
jgi:thymidylate kinase